MTNYRDEYRRWCEDSYFDDNTRQELKALTSEEEIRTVSAGNWNLEPAD